MSELKNQLKELILLLTVLSVLAGCADNIYQIENQNSYSLSEIHYITKSPEKKDKEILENIIKNSENKSTVHSSGVLLGGYYYKINDIKKSKRLIKEHIEGTVGSTKTAGEVWLSSIYKSESNNNRSQNLLRKANDYSRVKKFLIGKSCEKGVQFCLNPETEPESEKRTVKKRENIKSTKNKSKTKTEQKTNEDTETKEVKKEKVKTLKIAAVNTESNTSFLNGMIIAASEDNSTEIITDKNVNNNIIVNVRDFQIQYDNYTKNFDVNYNNSIKLVSNIIRYNRCNDVIVGVNDRFVDEGAFAGKLLKDKRENVKVRNYETSSFKALSSKYENNNNKRKCFLGIGREKDMTNFVPLVRFVSPDENLTKIFIITDKYTGMFEKEQVLDYFSNVSIYSFINTEKNAKEAFFNDKYQKIYGKKPETTAFLGYDSVLYLQRKYLGKQPSDISYASSIDNFDNDSVKRLIHFTRINKRLNIKHYGVIN